MIVGSGCGVILAVTLTKTQLYDWGWRLPFLLGLVIAPVALYIRRRFPETMQPGEAHRSGGAVLADLVRHHSRPVLLGVLILCGGTISTYVFQYMNTFAVTTLHLSETIGTMLTLTGAIAQIGGFATGVWLDRFGRKRMLVMSRMIFVLVVYPAYLVLTSPAATPGLIVAINMALNLLFGAGIGAAYAFLSEAFPKLVRSSGLAIAYALGTTVFGGTTQFVVAWLIHVTGNPLVPAWYQIVANAASIVGIILLTTPAEVLPERAACATL